MNMEKNAVVSRAVVTLLLLLSWIQAGRKGGLQTHIKILIVGTYWRHSWKLFSVGKQFLLVWADNPMADLLAVIAESVEDHKLFAFSFSGTRGWWL